MRNPLSALATALMLLLVASSADAADCLCDRTDSIESCIESTAAAANEEPRRPPMWCERGDDPRCMPAGTHSGAFQTLIPLSAGWVQTFEWTAPPRTATRIAIPVDGELRTAHSRRIERPPR